MLTCGIVGLPLAGKTTLFSLLTGQHTPEGRQSATAMANVPDPRLDTLTAMYKPRRTVYGQIQVTDIAGLSQGSGKSAVFLDAIRPVDTLIHVIRAFTGDFPHPLGSIDPMRDFDIVNHELLLADLALVETRLERAEKSNKGPGKAQRPVLEKCLAHLLEEKPMSLLDLTGEERELLQGLVFFTAKPQLVAVNIDEEDLGAEPPWLQRIAAAARDKGWPLLTLSVRIEQEISQLGPEEQKSFMEELNIAEPGTALLAREAYSLLGLQTFFTTGQDEVRAWAIKKGGTALDAARTIHSDMARGFIRADVISYADLAALGSEAAVKEKGLARLVGKDYIVQDGDILRIRFNV
ncbi:MAG: redox-regulated ATPase YchF [Firmicutes bacterium]|nr:redox-regulated ATPase YchF [Bacillota bacterium]HOB34819.1 redox-regulated ATPase YchF [Bacillota bacterium]HPZ90755.1 redox-regulated ATPase YchF [Bacillota bacterium]HQE01709.1 redox-regulated ATPase YchF [Bacillota bacterium]